MRSSRILIIFLLVLFLDWAIQRILPGMIWIAPAYILIIAIEARDVFAHLGLLIFMAVVVDIVSGVPFGIITSVLVLIVASIGFLKKRIVL